MSQQVSHSAVTRIPVFSGQRRVRGLWQRELADGTIVYEVQVTEGGRNSRIRLDARTKTDAILEQQALRVDHSRGEAPRTGSVVSTVAEFAVEFLDHLEGRIHHRDPARRYSPRTVALYRQRVDALIIPVIGNVRLDELRVTHLRTLVERLGARYAPSTVTSAVNIVSGLLRYAVKRQVIDRNVCRDLDRDDRPGVKRVSEPRYLDAAEVERLLANLSDTFRPVAAVCAYAGLRISEAIGLVWADIDLEAGVVTVARQLDDDGTLRADVKTLSSRATVPLLPVLVRELRATARARPSAIFVSYIARRLSSRRRAATRSLGAMPSVPSTPPATRPGSTVPVRRRSVCMTCATRSSVLPSTPASRSPRSPSSPATPTRRSPARSTPASARAGGQASPTSSSTPGSGAEVVTGLERGRRRADE
jgi:integrase